MAADRTPFFHGIGVNRKRRWCRTCTVYVEQRDLSGRACKDARSTLTAPGQNQAGFRELRERLSDERRIGVHAVCQRRGGDFLPTVETQGSHDVRRDGELNAF